MLLILDNFEHLLDGASITTDILKAYDRTKILATSRERLNLYSEMVYSIGGMVFPDWETPEDALEYEAIQLFMGRARLIQSDFELVSNDIAYLARICRLMEGMPLGIE